MAEASHAMGNSLKTFNIQYKGKSLYGLSQVLGLDRVYVGGSFVTTKVKPDDIDFVAGLKLTDPTSLWKRVSDLTFVPKEYGEHAMLAHDEEGLIRPI